LNMEWIYRGYRAHLIYGLCVVLPIHPIIRTRREKEQVGLRTDDGSDEASHENGIRCGCAMASVESEKRVAEVGLSSLTESL